MRLNFEKYQGAGNDFIIIDGFKEKIIPGREQIQQLCCRRFGIGADGLIIIEKSAGNDFEMRYFNSDGYEASMCGNGGRCAALFAYRHGYGSEKMNFMAADGIHNAEIMDDDIAISMNNVEEITDYKDGYFLNTGSPHFVKLTEKISDIDVKLSGKEIADDKRFAPGRTNVNFVEISSGGFKIATFERGVEDETLACGTGAVAVAIILSHIDIAKGQLINLTAKGGELKVSFDKNNNIYKNVKLIGPAEFVFSGNVDL